MGQTVQGVAIPLVQTRIEKVREVRVQTSVYRMVKSFVESSLRQSYEWRTAFEYTTYFEWRKEGKWRLVIEKHIEPTSASATAVRGVFRVKEPHAIGYLESMRGGLLQFVVLDNGEVAVLYSVNTPKETIYLAFTAEAPIVMMPMIHIPFSRPISIYELLDVLNHYVTF